MKKLISLFIIVTALAVSVNAQVDNKRLYEHKVQTFTKMKRTGWTMTGFGTAMTVGGIALMSTATWEPQQNFDGSTSYTTNDGSAIGGMLLLFTGLPIAITGVILGAIGTKKSKQYQRKLDNLSFVPVMNKNYRGLVLSYRF